MRKTLTIISVMALVLVGFIALANPVAADSCGCPPIKKNAEPYCHWGTNDAVPLGMNVAWTLTITVRNGGSKVWTDVVVKDRLAAELEIDYIYPCYPGTLNTYMKGNSDKVFIEWTIGTLCPCSTATLKIRISTDINPAGHQEYTTPGDYELNSGATLKYKMCGSQYSYSTEPIPITVVGEEED